MSNSPNCPYCGGFLVKKGLKKGKQCYICKDCGKWCTGDNPKPTIKFKDINTSVTCPYCGTYELTTSGFSKGGLRIYRCKFCNKRFTEGIEEKRKERRITGEVCPRCGSTNLVNKGIGRTGHPRYKCKSCGRSYTKDAKIIENEVRRRPEISSENKKKILMYKLNLKVKNKDIADHFNCSVYAIQQLVKEYYGGLTLNE